MKFKLLCGISCVLLFVISVSGQPIDNLDSLEKSDIKEKVEETSQEIEKDINNKSTETNAELEYQSLQEANKEIRRLQGKVNRLQQKVETLESRLENQEKTENLSEPTLNQTSKYENNVSEKEKVSKKHDLEEEKSKKPSGIVSVMNSIFR